MGVIDQLKDPEIQQFILDHENDNENELLLKHSAIHGVATRLIATQLAGRRKAKQKFPYLYQIPGILYPPSINLEQSSSETTAIFKSSLHQGKCLLDLTGGFGIDAYYFSLRFDQLTFVEPDAELLEIARYNHRLMGRHNIDYVNTTAADFLKSNKKSFDLVYADPSRRKSQRKVVSLNDSSPKILLMIAKVMSVSKTFLLKASPMLDIQSAISSLKAVSKVFVVSVDNDCRELLFQVEADNKEPEMNAVDLDASGKIISLVNFLSEEERNSTVAFSHPLTYLYEPNASALKSGAFRLMGNRFQLKKISPNTHLYTSSLKVEGFPGRIFEIVQEVKPEHSLIRKIINDGKANVLTRNYPLSAEQLKKKLKLKDGGEKYVIGFSGQKKRHVVIAKRIK
jgi:hypothetical protein